MKYATLKQNTWIFRRHYPKDVSLVLGTGAMKQSLKTGDVAVAKARVAEVNVHFDDVVRRVRAGLEPGCNKLDWSKNLTATIKAIDWTPPSFDDLRRSVSVGELAPVYLKYKAAKLKPSGYKAVRYSLGLFVSRHGDDLIASLGREDGKAFLRDIALLSATLGRSSLHYGRSLDGLLQASGGCSRTITVRTQKRIWSCVGAFLDWAVYEGHLEGNPFRTVRFDGSGTVKSYAVPKDEEVCMLLRQCRDERLLALLRICLLTGMRLGEARGLLRDEIVDKGNYGQFIQIKPNAVRGLKTTKAEREVPLHSTLQPVLADLPKQGPLFPGVSSNSMTKAFTKLRNALGLEHLVFHGTRKWFTTQCERTGVPEHFTASLVGHQSARSGNGLTYAIYSGGISDAQKRGIIDQLRLPS
jgi:integrase